MKMRNWSIITIAVTLIGTGCSYLYRSVAVNDPSYNIEKSKTFSIVTLSGSVNSDKLNLLDKLYLCKYKSTEKAFSLCIQKELESKGMQYRSSGNTSDVSVVFIAYLRHQRWEVTAPQYVYLPFYKGGLAILEGTHSKYSRKEAASESEERKAYVAEEESSVMYSAGFEDIGGFQLLETEPYYTIWPFIPYSLPSYKTKNTEGVLEMCIVDNTSKELISYAISRAHLLTGQDSITDVDDTLVEQAIKEIYD